jgi:hypothetical protein
MKYFILTSVVFVLCSFSTCNKKDQPGPVSIIGKWRWVKSIGGFAGKTTTPQTAGYSMREEFSADSTFKNYKNDSLIAQGSFSIIKNYKYADDQTINVLKLHDGGSQSFLIRNDTLLVNDIFMSDGFGSTYVRVK